MYLLGYDVGSSSVKAALVDSDTGRRVCVVQSPSGNSMPITAPEPGWAEQEPELWWKHVCKATHALLRESGVNAMEISGIGIAYQMHGLVCLDKDQQVVRPAIIWCDSRAVEIGQRAFDAIGHEKCLRHLLNSPGNFTASKLKWVREHEPANYERIAQICLPGDFIAMKLTGLVQTTAGGLSECILWDYIAQSPADLVIDHFGFDQSIIPEVVANPGFQGKTTGMAARETGLAPGTPVCYRAGDQPNNAISLNVLDPGQVAATGGTSGVIYGVSADAVFDQASRVNGFIHVNHTPQAPRIGTLLCINGAGIMYAWMRDEIAGENMSFQSMESQASGVPVGSEGLSLLPFGNGAERMLGNVTPGVQLSGIGLNRHRKKHLYRACLEGIAFAFVYGADILKELGIVPETLRVGNDNLFRSRIFSETVAHTLGAEIQVCDTTGAVGAAKAAGAGNGTFASLHDATQDVRIVQQYQPEADRGPYREAYLRWEAVLKQTLKYLKS